jgi:fumarylacetoacetate (FAA) hydrolase
VKVATIKTDHPDGQLTVVTDDLSEWGPAGAPTLQSHLDGNAIETPNVFQALDLGLCHAPLPRAYQFLDGSAYVNHVALVRQARGVEMPEHFWTDPLMYQGGSDGFLAPTDDIVGEEEWGIDFEGEIAVITDAVPRGASREDALKAVRFVMLLNDVSLRNLIPEELAKGFGFVQSKPACSCSPVAVSPDALPGWQDGVLHGSLNIDLNGVLFGRADAGIDMTFDFGTLIAHAAKTRDLSAGTIVGSGTVSNRGADGGPGLPVAQGGAGYSCIAEQRMVETIQTGAPVTPFLKDGDRVRMWMEDSAGCSIFGEINQVVRTR